MKLSILPFKQKPNSIGNLCPFCLKRPAVHIIHATDIPSAHACSECSRLSPQERTSLFLKMVKK